MSPRAASDAVIPGVAAISVGDPETPVPEGWTRVLLTDVARLETGHTPSRKHPEYWGGDIPWVSLPDARRCHGGVIHDTTQRTNEVGLANSAARLLPADTVCLSRTASVGYVFRLGKPMATSQDFVNWVCSEALDPRFLMYALMAEGDHILEFGRGSTHTTIYFPEVQSFHIALPPIAEQRRIVEKVEALVTHARGAGETSAHAASLVERLLQATFSAAVTGDLTAEWRKRQRVLPWRVVRAAEVCARVQSGGTPKAGFTSSGIPFLKVYNIIQQRVDFRRSQFVARDLHQGVLRKSITYPGDVVMNIVGPPLGKVAIVPDDYSEWNINQALTLFRPSSEITTEWLYILLAEGGNTADVLKDTKGIVGQVNISLSQCRNFEFALPSVAEQHEITRRVRRLLTLLERAKVRIISTVNRLNTLTSSILIKACAGELLPTEAELARREGRSYEPASALLARVRAERQPTRSSSLPRRRRTTAASGRPDSSHQR